MLNEKRKEKANVSKRFFPLRFNLLHRCCSKNKRNIWTNLIVFICVNQRCVNRCCWNLDRFRWLDVGWGVPHFVSKNRIASNRINFRWIVFSDVRIRKNCFIFSYFEIFIQFENVIIRNEFNFRWRIVQSDKTEFSTRCFIKRRITTKQKA